MIPATFVVAVNNQEVLRSNLLASALLQPPTPHEVLIQQGFSSAAVAYNDAIDRAKNELIICIHQDVFLPTLWLSQFEMSLEYLGTVDPAWGILGCYGVTGSGEYVGQIYSTGLGVIGKKIQRPQPIRTLDEIILVLRKSSGLRFDPDMPHFHLYGTDICLTAAERGLTCYSVPAFCIHNTQQPWILPAEFYRCYWHIKRKWNRHLPIHTSCMSVTRFDAEFHKRRFKEFCHGKLLFGPHAVPRSPDPCQIAEKLELTHGGLLSSRASSEN